MDDLSEVNFEYFIDLIYPKQIETKFKFEKPSGPAGRRPRTRIN